MDAAAIQARFDNELRASKGHQPFTANSFLDLWSYLRTGAENMVAEGRTSEPDVAEALANLRALLAGMEDERALRGYVEFREDTVARTFARLCPIWPFCR